MIKVSSNKALCHISSSGLTHRGATIIQHAFCFHRDFFPTRLSVHPAVGLFNKLTYQRTPMERNPDKGNSSIARLRHKYVFNAKDDANEKAGLGIQDRRVLEILEAYELGRVLGRRERFDIPNTVSVMRLGYFRMEVTLC